jgi:hypothetical protein
VSGGPATDRLIGSPYPVRTFLIDLDARLVRIERQTRRLAQANVSVISVPTFEQLPEQADASTVAYVVDENALYQPLGPLGPGGRVGWIAGGTIPGWP